MGKEAPSLIRKRSSWIIDAKGNRVKGWRIEPNETFPAFQWAASSKYLEVIISNALFEQQTLQHRINEAKQKLHLVCKFVYNRRVARTRARLRV